MANSGKFRNHVVLNESKTLATSPQTSSEVEVPVYGDIMGFIIEVTGSIAGTLVGAKKTDKFIRGITVRNKQGENLTDGIRGEDLLFLERLRSVGINRTLNDVANSSVTDRFLLPINIERKDQTCKIQLEVATHGEMVTSGSTGGALAYRVCALYYDGTEKVYTEKIQRIELSLINGTNGLAHNIRAKGIITEMLMKFTETIVTEIKFSGDGQKELESFTPGDLICLDNSGLVSGHKANEFKLRNSPFAADDKTVLELKTNNTDTLQLFLISVQ